MSRTIRIAAVASASCVLCVPAVPAFAQSDIAPAASMAIERTSLTAARHYVPAEVVEVAPGRLPRNLLIPRVYRPLLESMLRDSPTFARQCLRIANAPELTVSVQLVSGASGLSRAARASTRIERQDSRLIATVILARTVGLAELIAHEIEHVIEQLDGVDLASKAQVPHSGVHIVHQDGLVYETARARRIGLMVAQELRRPPPRRWPAW
jgi:hypothetical protein